MKRVIVRSLIAFLLMGLYGCSEKKSSQVETDIDWPSFLAQHDLVWEVLPLQWNEGAFVGNGQVGMMIYATMKDNRMDFHIGRQDVTDHRGAPDRKTSLGVEGTSIHEHFPRLSIGRMALRPAGRILSGTMHQDLWNAEIRGTIVTDLGEITFRAYTPYDRMLNIVEVSSTEQKEGRYAPYTWDYLRGNANAPRSQTHPHSFDNWSHYEPNPPAEFGELDGVSTYVQPLLAGGDFASAWIDKPGSREGEGTLLLSTANEVPQSGVSARVAVETVKEAASMSAEERTREHRSWWHEFYPKSFLTFPDGRLESFYWIQLYKMATSSRPDGPAVDLFGPYFRISQWGGHWWNLNVQLTYWPVYPTNHLELGESLIHTIDEFFDPLLQRAANTTRRSIHWGLNLGDFTWLMHNYWLQFAYDGDWQSLREKWLPKAVQIFDVFQEISIVAEDGTIHLPPMSSPEYIAKDDRRLFKNSNYGLAVYNWLLQSMIEVTERTDADRTQLDTWRETLANLHEFPVDEHGLMIGSDQSVDQSHRHYSHLLALYPLYVLNPDSPRDSLLLDKSVDHWHSIYDGRGLSGYSFTGAASLFATLGRGDDALANIQQFLTGDIGTIGILFPNTFYAETHGKSPCFESPLSTASAIAELAIQSWGGKIRVFPATPTSWDRANFHQMRAKGGFLVSASRREGQTKWVQIESLRGEPVVVKIPGWNKAVQAGGDRDMVITPLGNYEFELDLQAGETVLLAPDSRPVSAVIEPVWHPSDEQNLYGVREGENLEEIMVWPEVCPVTGVEL